MPQIEYEYDFYLSWSHNHYVGWFADQNNEKIRNKIIDVNFINNYKFLPSEIENDAVDYNKGCYIGQEVTSRIKHRNLNKKIIRIFKKCNFKKNLQQNFEIIFKYKEYVLVKFKAEDDIEFIEYDNSQYRILK